jgi:hypothetical protein
MKMSGIGMIAATRNHHWREKYVRMTQIAAAIVSGKIASIQKSEYVLVNARAKSQNQRATPPSRLSNAVSPGLEARTGGLT